MTELIDQVRESFDRTEGEHQVSSNPIQFIGGDEQLCPGFEEMREAYLAKMLVLTRRGYRHHAGSSFPTQADPLLEQTGKTMLASLIALVMEAFCDGVLVGHQQHITVLMTMHYGNVGHVFHEGPENEDFSAASLNMCHGFAEDGEVVGFFTEYVKGGILQLSHVTGFAHTEGMDPGKVWDLWLMIGSATTATAYLAGHGLGSKWREKDLLDGIELASEEGPDGFVGEADSHQ